jgi:hypothetical protein
MKDKKIMQYILQNLLLRCIMLRGRGQKIFHGADFSPKYG